jgi:ATP-dependent DNA helicase RecQ
MPAVPWTIHRLCARLGAIDGLVPPADPTRAVLDRFQELTSAVAVTDLSGSPLVPGASDDDRFVAQLALGLLCRGWPTLVSPIVEQTILGSSTPNGGLHVESTKRMGDFGWFLAATPGAADRWPSALGTALATRDPRLAAAPTALAETIGSASAHEWDSVSERHFYEGELSALLGNAMGLVELQRPLDTMVPPEAQPEHGPWVSLPWRRADLALELPDRDGPYRLNVELDGPHHEAAHQGSLDSARDKVLRDAGWTVVRIPVAELDAPGHKRLVALRSEVQRRTEADPMLRALVAGHPIAPTDPIAVEALRVLVTPHAIARVQLGVVQALLGGSLRLNAGAWEIVAVEREVPCAELALLDLLETLRRLCRLYGIPFGVERVRLRISQEHLAAFPPLEMDGFPEEVRRLVAAEPLGANGGPADVPDLVLDAAVLARPTQVYPTNPPTALGVVGRTHLVLRTAHRIAGSEPPTWDAPRPVSLEPSDHSLGWDAAGADNDLAGVRSPETRTAPRARREPLRYFLQSLFRKPDFRPGQLEIIDRALARRDVIGLLPTGAGKSLCYQLPALLSPGQTLVVDPIKSLMQDQVANLAAAGIHDAVAINSDLTPRERRTAEAAFGRGDYRFVFVSPERLQMAAFRELVTSVGQARPTAFVVVDEAHCVSEWGHDFRIAYLNLGRLSRELCVFQDEAPPMVALTGTASRAVLVDVQRELRIDDDEAIVSPANFDRPELHFAVESVASPGKLPRLARWITDELPEAGRLGIALERLVSGEHGGIVFCPHVNGPFGAYPVHQQIGNALGLHAHDGQAERVAFYSGSLPKALEKAGTTEWQFVPIKAGTQQRFKRDDLAILVATKAFGMGIDKPNIRYTIHYDMAKSVEAFAQEAGRAGRDRAKAICLVLFSDNRDGQTDAPDPLELGIGVEESRKRMPARGEPQDDADRALWLHAQSYAGVDAEATAIRGFYRLFVRPAVNGSDAGSVACPPIVDREPMARLSQEGWLPKTAPADGIGNGTSPGRGPGPADDSPKIDFQRIVYRLSLLGIVEDYTIE